MLITYLTNFFLSLKLSETMSHNLAYLSLLCIFIILSLILRYIVKYYFTIILPKNKWDNAFIENRLPDNISLIIPVVVVFCFIHFLFPVKSTVLINVVYNVCLIYIIIVSVRIIYSITNSVIQIYNQYELSSHTPIKSFAQMFKMVVLIIAVILIISLLTQKSPWSMLTALGALTAIAMLVFKDSILGLAASVQLSTQKMVRIGDRISMPKFDAQGFVIDISLTTVKVRNFDKTIINIPAYAMVSNSFQNWRGMTESGVRRIKRSINLDMNTFKFLDESDINRLKRFDYLEEYLTRKYEEINEYNKNLNINIDDSVICGRKLTNIGTFRFYVKEYLKKNTDINKNMMFNVRQLQPTEKGMPLEIYVFADTTIWVDYEKIQADIFDHLLTAVPEFGLSIYQDPTGLDFRKAFTQKS